MFHLFLITLLSSALVSQVSAAKTLRVYTYDALTGRDSLGEHLSQQFFKETGIQVKMVSFGTAGEAANQILLEGKSCQADILLGIDEILFHKLKEKSLFEPLELKVLEQVEPFLLGTSKDFLPFDYGYLSFVYDERRTKAPVETSLRDFPRILETKGKIVLQDPRTSSLGSELLVWTKLGLGAQFEDFWKALIPRILTISPGWSGAYELFLKKQADFVLSYTTSPAYHVMRENLKAIKSLDFKEGHFRQIEGAVLLRSSSNKQEGNLFLGFLIGKNIQERLPTFQWMYPARRKAELPKEFREIKIPKPIKVDWAQVTSHKEACVRDWMLIMSKGTE